MLAFINDSFVFGAQWSIEPQFRTAGEFTDNLRLSSDSSQSVWTLRLSASAGIDYATELLKITALPRYEHARFFSDEPIDKTFNNFFLPLSTSYRTEVDRFSFDVSINRDNALVSELEETGVVTSFLQRNSRNIQGSWDRSFTETFTSQTNYEFRDVNFERTSSSNLSDFQAHSGAIGATYQWSEETEVQMMVRYSNLHAPQNSFRSQSPGFDLRVAQRVFETLSLSGSGGLRYVLTTFSGDGQRIKDKNLIGLFNIRLDKEWERSQLTVGYSRTLNPSGLGVLFVTDQANLRIEHQLTQRLEVSILGRFIKNDTVGSSASTNGTNNSQFWQVAPSMSWRLTENWSWDSSYRYAQRKIKGSSEGRAQSNTVNMALTYRWSKWSSSP